MATCAQGTPAPRAARAPRTRAGGGGDAQVRYRVNGTRTRAFHAGHARLRHTRQHGGWVPCLLRRSRAVRRSRREAGGARSPATNRRPGHHRRPAQRHTRQGLTILVMGRRAMSGDVMIRGRRAMNDDRANADADWPSPSSEIRGSKNNNGRNIEVSRLPRPDRDLIKLPHENLVAPARLPASSQVIEGLRVVPALPRWGTFIKRTTANRALRDIGGWRQHHITLMLSSGMTSALSRFASSSVPRHVLDRRPTARPHLVEQLSDEPEGVDLIVVLAGGEAQQLAAQRGVPR
jgi:hypothetical protein